MNSTVTKFQHALSEVDVECQAIREQVEKYSDADGPTDGDVTQAIALLNSVRGIRKLFEAINAA